MSGTAQTTTPSAPVRAGDAFDYAGTGRVATVIAVMPGGRATVRVEGYRNGKASLRISEERVAEIKQWQRLGRADFQDGLYLSAMGLLQAGTAHAVVHDGPSNTTSA